MKTCALTWYLAAIISYSYSYATQQHHLSGLAGEVIMRIPEQLVITLDRIFADEVSSSRS